MIDQAVDFALVLALRPGVSLVDDSANGRIHLLQRGVWQYSQAFEYSGVDYRRVLSSAAAGEIVRGENGALGIRHGGAISELSGESIEFVERLARDGWLTVTVCAGSRRLYAIRPLRELPPQCLDPSPYSGPSISDTEISRFVVVRREVGVLLESPLAPAHLELYDPDAASVFARLLSGADRIEDPVPGLLARLVRDLGLIGMLAAVTGERTEPGIRQWRPQDLWFHRRSRRGNGGYDGLGFGRTGWGKELGRPEPARRANHPGSRIELPRPDLRALCTADVPLARAVEERRSHRTFDDAKPIRLQQISELLYRSARVRSQYVLEGTECLSVPYPSGGAVYELEIYLVARLVDGLAPGFYHYEKFEHRLRQLSGANSAAAQMLRTAAAAAAVRQPPQAMFVITARFGRLLPTYEEVPYALVLKHVGALYQTLYLAATAVGVGLCGLGAGDSDTFETAVGLDFTEEGSVGEMIIGSVAERS